MPGLVISGLSNRDRLMAFVQRLVAVTQSLALIFLGHLMLLKKSYFLPLLPCEGGFGGEASS
jgi:hypothetical protein